MLRRPSGSITGEEVSGAPVIAEFPVTCVYCGRRTGISSEPDRKTVCYGCQWSAGRDEAKENAAGMRPWARPLSFWVRFFGWQALPDAEAAIEQAKWDRQQAAIGIRNESHEN